MDEIIVSGEPTLVIRSPLIPRTLLCNSLLHPLLSQLKSPEDFVAFVSESCIAFPKSLDVVLVTAFWPRCVFNQVSQGAVSRPVQTIKPQHLMLVERELYLKLTKKSCLFGDFLDSLLLHNDDKRKVSVRPESRSGSKSSLPAPIKAVMAPAACTDRWTFTESISSLLTCARLTAALTACHY